MRQPARLVALALSVAVLTSCGGDTSGPSSSSTTHAITVAAGLFNATVDKPIVEVALLIDGVQVGSSTTYTGGTGNASLSPPPIGVTAGSHRVAIRVIQQRFASVTYQVIGSVIGSNDATGVIVQQSFPASATLRAGEQVEMTINVP